MNREFAKLFERELGMLYERAAMFAAEYPGVSERLGGLGKEQMDPGVKGLLEGSAFLAARVQLKLRSEFQEFTSALLEQVLPGYLAPTPSAMLLEAKPNIADPNLVNGLIFPAGSYVDTVYVIQKNRISCRYRLSSSLEIWPIEVTAAKYHTALAQMQSPGMDLLPVTMSGLRLTFTRPSQEKEGRDDKPEKFGANPVADLALDRLKFHFAGGQSETDTLYTLLFANCRRMTIRHKDSFGNDQFMTLPPSALRQIGFEPEDSLFPEDDRMFRGLSLLREYFVFPNKFRGFALEGLSKFLRRIEASEFDILFEFDALHPQIAPLVKPSMFRLHSAPAVNLFELQCTPIPVNANESEHLLVPDRSDWLKYEPHRILNVTAIYRNTREPVVVHPLHRVPLGAQALKDMLFYTFRRRRRLRTERERRFENVVDYLGSEIMVSLYEPEKLDASDRVRNLNIRALCSNRHIPVDLPIGDGGAEFYMVDNTEVMLSCIAGPTPPRESIADVARAQGSEKGEYADVKWRLINLLSFNHLGLSDRGTRDSAGPLREVLSLFTSFSDIAEERRLRGILSVSSRPVVRRLRRDTGFYAARGLEITVTVEDKAFEGQGVGVLGAVLDRFFAEYVSLNSFTETVIASSQRGVLKRWPARSGTGPVI